MLSLGCAAILSSALFSFTSANHRSRGCYQIALTMNPQHCTSLATIAIAWAYSGSDTQQLSHMIDFIRLARASIANGLAIRSGVAGDAPWRRCR